jgi:TonB-dependent starch-binding outer membrane protein SusC
MKKCVLKHVIYMTKLFAIAFLIQSLSMSVLIASDGNAQVKSIEEVQVSISIKNVKVERAFQELEKKTGYNFVFANREIRNLPSISLESKGQSVYDVLMDIAFQTDLSFKQVNENIHVKTRNPLKQKNQIETSEFDEVEIKGRVLDQKGDPLPGVTVVVEGTSIGTVTDIDGYYTISAPENGFLLFSFIGFETQRQSVTNKSEINVTLIEDAQSLEEVVVIGYGTQKRENLTGSISSISSKKLVEVPVSTVEQALQGNAAGVMVSQTGGSPGAAVSVRVRGIGSINGAVEPLYVVDGSPIENVPFGGGGDAHHRIFPIPRWLSLNPGEIESIEILKDASATAIYGARGANGVVLITTKRGKSGKTVVTYDTYIGVTGTCQKTLDVLNAQQNIWNYRMILPEMME